MSAESNTGPTQMMSTRMQHAGSVRSLLVGAATVLLRIYCGAARRLRRVHYIVHSLGLTSGMRFLVLDILGVRQPVRVWSNGLEEFLYLRPRTSDIDVLYNTLNSGEYEFTLPEPVKTIVDAGANIGCTTLAFAARYPNARIIAIEPESRNFELLQLNLAGCANVSLIRAALSDSTGTVELHDRGTGAWGFTICLPSVGSSSSVERVRCLTVDDLMCELQIDHVDLLKLDIEGAEQEVLGSSSGWIARVGAIAAELHDRFHPGCFPAFQRATAEFGRVDRRRNVAIAIRN